MNLFSWFKTKFPRIRRKRGSSLYSSEDDWRKKIIRQFSDWLYELTEEEGGKILQDNIPEDIPDLRSFYTELTVLNQAIELQTRAVRQSGREMTEGLESISTDFRKEEERIFGVVKEIRRELKDEKTEIRNELLQEIIEIRESVLNTCRTVEMNQPPSRFWNRKTRRTRGKIHESQGMLIRKIDDALRRLRVSPLARVGDDFDAGVMRAISVNKAGARPSGQVSAIIRQGYRRDEKILHYAEVEVTQ
jgi:molecular chaperone GrpE (heat shock protein)